MVIEIDDTRWDLVSEITGNAGSLCFQCGMCSAGCPVAEYTGNPVNMRKLIRSAQTGTDYSDELWGCATCRLCENTCPRGVDITDVTLALRSLAFHERKTPDRIEKVLWDIYENGNPWGGSRKERAAWTEGLDIKNASDGVDVLLYIGCEAAYDRRMHNIVRSLVGILKAARINFGILGNDEKCCGEPLKNAGESGYLEELAGSNIENFNRTGAGVIVTVSPHCSAMFNSTYRKYSLETRVVHYAQYLHELFSEGRIELKGNMERKITYHDPCVLSRTDHVTAQPRELLLNISGIELGEMPYSGTESLCCGGGGNRMFLEFNGPRLSDLRIRQAKETGADLLVTACPYCNMNLHDSSSTQDVGIEVRDLAEVLREAVK